MKAPRLVAAALLAAAFAGCADNDTVFPPGPVPDTVTVAFRDGASPDAGYNGTRDALLKDGPTNDFRNRCYGTTPRDTIGAVSLAGALYERRLVIKMDLSSITDCAAVVSATLVVALEEAFPDSITLAAHRISRPSYSPWIEGQNGLQTGVSWLTVDGAEAWYQEGGDIDAQPFALARISGDTAAAFSVPPALARAWIANPASNHGVLIRSAAPFAGRFALVSLRGTPDEEKRPRFELVYLRGG